MIGNITLSYMVYKNAHAKSAARSVRTKQELEKSTEILASIEKDVGPQSIHDCFRLGKYKESNSHPQPVLIKMNRFTGIDQCYKSTGCS